MEFAEPVMRPPQEAASLVLQATQGCTWNDCHFCYVSRGFDFAAVTPDQLTAAARRGMLGRRPDTAIYLAGSNPFALSAGKLKDWIAALRREIPGFSGLSMQARVDDIARKSADELEELRDLGLSHLYIGTENGHEAVLKLMNKGHTAADTAEQGRRLRAAGIPCTMFYVLGLGGRGMGAAAGAATAAMFNEARPHRVTTTGMTVFPRTPLADMAARGEFVEASEREKIEELLVFLETLEAGLFYDGVHYLNPLNYRLDTRNAAHRQVILEDIREILRTHSDEELELMVGRRLMTSL